MRWRGHHSRRIYPAFVVQWHNISHARDGKGADMLLRVPKKVIRGDRLPEEECVA
jgi:hypothetical protein